MPVLSNIIEAPLRLLGESRVDCVIVGGVAAAIHGSLLLTNDLDICHSRDAPNLERLASMKSGRVKRIRAIASSDWFQLLFELPRSWF